MNVTAASALHVPRPGARPLERIRDYTRPRPTTVGDLPAPSATSGAIAGAIQGYITGRAAGDTVTGMIGAAAGSIGGYVGVKAGEATNSFGVALGAGAVVGGAVAAATTLGLSAMLGGGLPLPALAGPALMGSFIGAVGALSGSRRAVTRDSVYGGMLTGAMAALTLGNPALVLAGAAGAGAGGRGVTPAGRVVVAALAGAGTGALAGLVTGNILQGALVGAAMGPVGTLVGPVLRQVQRNATEDLTLGINKRLDPWLEKHPLSTRGKLIAGAASIGLMLAPIGLVVAGWQGAGVAAGLGAALGAVSTYRLLKNREKARKANQILERYAILADTAYRYLPPLEASPGASPASQGVTAAAQGPRTAAQGSPPAAQGPRTASQGSPPAAQGPRTASQGVTAAAQGPRTASQGSPPAAQGPRTASQGSPPAAQGPRTAAKGSPPAEQGTEARPAA